LKKFHFPLDRVLDWRRTQGRLEEAKLEQLYREAHDLEARQQALLQERADSEQAVLAAPSTTGLQLAALGEFSRFTTAQHALLERQRAECAKLVAAQVQVLTAKRREIRLLERLREQRLDGWSADLDREIGAQADEAFLAKWAGKSAGLQ
jgi:flagellar export protein FliJ